MTALNKTEGDLLAMARKGQFDIIVHGANCFNTMASGIAGQISREHPEAAEADRATESGDRGKLGNYTMALVQEKGLKQRAFTIVNAYTQYTYGRKGDLFEYDAFEKFLANFETFLRSVYVLAGGVRKTRVGFPYIGCGLAGGDEERIVEMIENFSVSCQDIANVTLVRFVRDT